ncbi:MAG: DUF423 domain-containing protein [Betaproteobacteria bacterium]|nr:MAG: DUF423 domain-containing protein [Betaproteobacteria bacterium]
MTTGAKLFLTAGGLAALAAVVLGAFGAHALKSRLSAEMLAVWHTGVEYHVYHALGLLAVGLVATQLPESALLKWSGWLMLAGIALFSGSLYALALSGERWLGAITPIGGLGFLAAWTLFVAAVVKA